MGDEGFLALLVVGFLVLFICFMLDMLD